MAHEPPRLQEAQAAHLPDPHRRHGDAGRLVVVGYGHKAGNAFRWLAIGPIHIQPAETAKLGIVLWLAYSLSKKADRIKSFSVGFLPHLIVVGVLALLCLKQPDFGSAVVLLFLPFTLLFVAGARVPYIAALTMLMGFGAAILVRFSGYRWARYLAWMDMENNRNDLAYQPFQSVMSFGSGGFAGLGLGRGLQVLYLPEAHTDFISAIIGEELGFLGILALLCAAYLLIVSRGVSIALEAADDYGSFLAFGIASMFGVQALTNLAVAMAILPTKGLTLPFLSFGGSSLLVNAAAVGILLSISRPRTNEPEPSRSGAKASAAPSASALVATSADEGAAGVVTVLIAGGGTGGHVFPMLAVGDALRAADPEGRVVYVGTARGIEQRVIERARRRAPACMDILPLRGGGVRGLRPRARRGPSPRSRRRARLVPRAPPRGGALGGRLRRRAGDARGQEPRRAGGHPRAEQRARALEPPAHGPIRLALVRRLPRDRAHPPPEHRAPLGRAAAAAPSRARRTRRRTGRCAVLVLGGSQGARGINEAVPRDRRRGVRAGADVEVVHQTGRDRDAAVRALYAELGLAGRARVVPFIDDVAQALAAADLVIGRAGAASLAELCAVGRPSLLVAYPFAADDHQFQNARLARAAPARRSRSPRARPRPRGSPPRSPRLANDEPCRRRMAAAARGARRSAARLAGAARDRRGSRARPLRRPRTLARFAKEAS